MLAPPQVSILVGYCSNVTTLYNSRRNQAYLCNENTEYFVPMLAKIRQMFMSVVYDNGRFFDKERSLFQPKTVHRRLAGDQIDIIAKARVQRNRRMASVLTKGEIAQFCPDSSFTLDPFPIWDRGYPQPVQRSPIQLV